MNLAGLGKVCGRDAALVLCASLTLLGGVLHAQPSPAAQKLRIVGGLAGVNQYTRHEEPFWSKELPRLSAGKYTATVVPFESLGVPGAEMLRLIQSGTVPFGTLLLSSLTSKWPAYTAPDLAGLNPSMASLQTTVAAFRPYLEQTLRQRNGLEVLAVYAYPAQVVFCNKPFTQLADLKGRTVRVSSPTQSDFVDALGGVAVMVPFAQVLDNMRSGNTNCAITGTMSANTMGLHEVTTHVHQMPINWGISVFAANRQAWDGLPQDLKTLLRAELPKLESRIWAESQQETVSGLACNTGAPGCRGGRSGKMVLVSTSAADEKLATAVFASSVLPRWLQRCGKICAEVWNDTIGPARGILAPAATVKK